VIFSPWQARAVGAPWFCRNGFSADCRRNELP